MPSGYLKTEIVAPRGERIQPVFIGVYRRLSAAEVFF
jgi:hypothetical protein